MSPAKSEKVRPGSGVETPRPGRSTETRRTPSASTTPAPNPSHRLVAAPEHNRTGAPSDGPHSAQPSTRPSDRALSPSRAGTSVYRVMINIMAIDLTSCTRLSPWPRTGQTLSDAAPGRPGPSSGRRWHVQWVQRSGRGRRRWCRRGRARAAAATARACAASRASRRRAGRTCRRRGSRGAGGGTAVDAVSPVTGVGINTVIGSSSVTVPMTSTPALENSAPPPEQGLLDRRADVPAPGAVARLTVSLGVSSPCCGRPSVLTLISPVQQRVYRSDTFAIGWRPRWASPRQVSEGRGTPLFFRPSECRAALCRR